MTTGDLDVLISGGMLLDGLGGPARRADVGVRERQTVILPPGPPARASVRIDAAGCYVAPGFIDIHGHSDFSSLTAPAAASRVAAGITTEVVGNCGYGAFPLDGEVLARRLADNARGPAITWRDAEGYFRQADQTGCAINRVVLIGHGNVRGSVVGYANRKASPAQLDAMRQIVGACMAAGCAGLSSGLPYPPGMWADTDELASLAEVVAAHGGIYASHIRNEGDTLIESVGEFLEILRRAGCRGQLSHVKAAEPQNWPKIERLGHMLFAARAEGLDVFADRYPYTASATDLGTMMLPGWAMEGGLDHLMSRLADAATRQRLAAEARAHKGAYYDRWLGNVVVTSTARPELRDCVGKSLAELPAPMGERDAYAAGLKLLHDDRAETQAVHHSMSPDNLREIYTWPFVCVGSDSSCRDYFGSDTPDKPHPRAYGTPGEFIDLVVRKWRTMGWPAAIAKMTSLPAEIMGLTDRGVLRDGSAGDIVVLDPQRFRSPATYESPCLPPEGLVATLVNGQVVWQNGQHTSKRPGQLLRHGQS